MINLEPGRRYRVWFDCCESANCMWHENFFGTFEGYRDGDLLWRDTQVATNGCYIKNYYLVEPYIKYITKIEEL